LQLTLLGEGAGWIAVDKSAGVVVVPARGEDPAGSLWRRLEVERGHRLWVVHRVDRDTSGVVLFATTAEAHRDLSVAFTQRRVHKEYLAFTRGVPSRFELDAPLAERGRKVVVDPAGQRSHTSVRVELRTTSGVALVRAFPITGRRHQIRVHLADAGAPLLVDPLYGSAEPILDRDGSVVCDRLTLHAARIVFPVPGDGFEEEIAAPWPADLARLHRTLLS
jgi:23S rRNA-/tRNA-specific pseudouridylate synthase